MYTYILFPYANILYMYSYILYNILHITIYNFYRTKQVSKEICKNGNLWI